jgi:hypothetical protein
MTQGYKIMAWSPSTTHVVREVELDGNIIVEAGEAQRRADSFAQRMNQQREMQAADWQGRIELIHT